MSESKDWFGGPSTSNLDEKCERDEVARRATGPDFPFASHGELVLRIKQYSNTTFVNIILERHFFSRIQKISDNLGMTPELIISEALNLMVKKLEGMAEQKNAQSTHRPFDYVDISMT